MHLPLPHAPSTKKDTHVFAETFTNTFNSSNNKNKQDTCVVGIVCKSSLSYSWWDFGKFSIQHKYPCYCHTIPLHKAPKREIRETFHTPKKTYVHEQINFQNLARFMYVQKSNTPNNEYVLTCFIWRATL